MEKFLGVDVGGTNVKFGCVGTDGKISKKKKFKTANLGKGSDFLPSLLELIRKQIEESCKVEKIGLGIPGTLTKDRRVILETPNVSQLNGLHLMDSLQEKFPDKIFHLENDANAAALGELYFSPAHLPDNFIFITLGTGIGGAAIIDRQIFKGGDGNSMEVGHIVSSYGTTIEQKIGKKGLVNLTYNELSRYTGATILTDKFPLTSKNLENAAENGDELAIKVFSEVGTILGEALVSIIRILDIKTVVIGGGVADNYDNLVKSMHNSLEEYLTSYYLKDINIQKASLGNDAGIIGAASLGFID
jgi:glucokinase